MGNQIQGQTSTRTTLTFDLQLAVHLGFSQVIYSLAGVHATIIGARLPDLQSAYSLVAKHAIPWVIDNHDLIFHPDHLSLQSDKTNISGAIDKATAT